MKKYISFFLAFVLAFCPASSFICSAITVNENGDTDIDFSLQHSGNYSYVAMSEDDEIYFCACNAENLTVLEIPEEIDGKKVCGSGLSEVSSNCLTKVIYPESMQYISNFIFYSQSTPVTPICSIVLNNNLTTIKGTPSYYSLSEESIYPIESKLLILPSQNMTLFHCGLLQNHFENIVITGNPVLKDKAISISGYDWFFDNTKDYKGNVIDTMKKPCSVYFAGDCDNSSPSAFDYRCHIDLNEGFEPEQFQSPNVTIYKKSEAQGFERFQGENYQNYLLNESDNAENWQLWNGVKYELPPGYTVKEYTDEWWNDIKEIESVTLSGTGLTENAEVTQKLSESELKWMDKEYSLNMKSGEKVKLSGTFAPSDAFDNRMFFVSLDEDFVKVDVDSGEVTALKKGTATVRCVAASGVFSDVVVSVDGGGMSEKASTTDTTNTNNSTKLISSPAKDNAPTKDKTLTVKPVYIIIPACAAIIAAAAIVVVKRKKK